MKKIVNKIKEYIFRNKSTILLVVLILISISSIVFQNIKSKDEIEINNVTIKKEEYSNKIAVYIAGEVVSPGVYYIDENTRLDDLIKACGGLTEDADISDINLAEKLNDSDKIDIPKKSSNESVIEEDNDVNDDLVNINTASVEELEQLNGVGPTLAKNIVEYRKNNKFTSIEDLLNVNGIGQAKYNKIKQYICVK